MVGVSVFLVVSVAAGARLKSAEASVDLEEKAVALQRSQC